MSFKLQLLVYWTVDRGNNAVSTSSQSLDDSSKSKMYHLRCIKSSIIILKPLSSETGLFSVPSSLPHKALFGASRALCFLLPWVLYSKHDIYHISSFLTVYLREHMMVLASDVLSLLCLNGHFKIQRIRRSVVYLSREQRYVHPLKYRKKSSSYNRITKRFSDVFTSSLTAQLHKALISCCSYSWAALF